MKWLIFLTFFIAAYCTKAQQKIGFVYVDSLLAIMPETKQADSLFQAEQARWVNILADLEVEIQKTADSMARNVAGHGFDGREYNRLKEQYELKMKEYAVWEQKAQDSLKKYSEDLYGRVNNILNKLIEEVALEKGFITVLNANNEVLYFDKRYNLTDEVRKKLTTSNK